VTAQGGPAPWEVFATRPAASTADPDAVTAVVCGLAGFFAGGALLPPPPGIPHLRAFQAMQAEPTLAWLRRLTGWR
jgi:hypothetical protein